MAVGYVGVPKDIIYDTEGTQSNLQTLHAVLYRPDGTQVGPNDAVVGTDANGQIPMTEIGTTGVYKGTFTPNVVGTWVVVVSDPNANPVIDNKAGTIVVLQYSQQDLAGAAYNPATDSQHAIRAAIDGVAATVNAPSARGRVIV